MAIGAVVSWWRTAVDACEQPDEKLGDAQRRRIPANLEEDGFEAVNWELETFEAYSRRFEAAFLAPQVGFEPTTLRLTAEPVLAPRSTNERLLQRSSIVFRRSFGCHAIQLYSPA